jgi:hypothetical protein
MVSKKKVNKMSNNEVIINQKEHTDIYDWLSKNVYDYENEQKHYTLTKDKKINAYCDVFLKKNVSGIKYPFGAVNGCFCMDSSFSLKSFIGSPETVDGYFSCDSCKDLTSLIGFPKIINTDIYLGYNKFSNNPKYKEEYKLYLAMWLELLESVTNKEREEYITNYKDKVDKDFGKPIIPIEILKEYGF